MAASARRASCEEAPGKLARKGARGNSIAEQFVKVIRVIRVIKVTKVVKVIKASRGIHREAAVAKRRSRSQAMAKRAIACPVISQRREHACTSFGETPAVY